MPDLLATLVTEAAIHHIDLMVSLPGPAGPPPAATRVPMSTLSGLAGPEGLPATWSPVETLRTGAGREPLSPEETARLGERFPLLG